MTTRRYIILLYSLLVLAITTGCTRNNGDIGDWFGSWRVESITIDGKPDPNYAPPYMIWQFQSQIISINLPDDTNHEAHTGFGTWDTNDDTITLDFEWGWDNHASITHLPQKATLDIVKLTHGTIELRYIADDGTVYFYTLKRWG